MTTETTTAVTRLAAIRTRWAGDRPGLLTIVDNADEDAKWLLGLVDRLTAALRSVHCELYEDEGTREGAFAVIEEALGEAPTDLVGHVAKVLHRDWSALPDWELRAAARFTLGAIHADGKVVVSREDLATWLDHTGEENFAAEVASLNRLRAALADQKDGDDRG